MNISFLISRSTTLIQPWFRGLRSANLAGSVPTWTGVMLIQTLHDQKNKQCWRHRIQIRWGWLRIDIDLKIGEKNGDSCDMGDKTNSVTLIERTGPLVRFKFRMMWSSPAIGKLNRHQYKSEPNIEAYYVKASQTWPWLRRCCVRGLRISNRHFWRTPCISMYYLALHDLAVGAILAVLIAILILSNSVDCRFMVSLQCPSFLLQSWAITKYSTCS